MHQPRATDQAERFGRVSGIRSPVFIPAEYRSETRLAGLIAAIVLISVLGAPAQVIPPMPPATPQKDETAISGANDPVVKVCVESESKMQKDLKLTVLKVVITKSPKWGTIWRTDRAFPVTSAKEQPAIFRSTCWKGGIQERPLEMFDPKASIKPLK